MPTANRSISRELDYIDLGTIKFKEAWDLQNNIFRLRSEEKINDTLLLLEHYHTYTLGKTADENNLLLSEKGLQENKIEVHNIDRGGDITYHGPGQIVGYPIIKLSDWKEDTHLYLRNLEEVIIRVCSDFGLDCYRIDGLTGVWINDRKIASIGIKVSRWITMHGFAFNVNTDLDYFSGIIPCGIKDKNVTSLAKEIGREEDIDKIKKMLLTGFKELFEYSGLNRVSTVYLEELLEHEK